MKDSLKLVIIQLLNISVGLFSIYYVAKEVSPQVYAVVSVGFIITSLVSTFSFFGIEDNLKQNVLFWLKNKQEKRIKVLVSQALFQRLLFYTILIPPLLLYIYFIVNQKFDGSYFNLFLLFLFGGLINALHHSFALILKAFDKFVTVAFSELIIGVLIKTASVAIFILLGFKAYIYCLVFLPILPATLLGVKLVKWMNIKYFTINRSFLRALKNYQWFGYASYLRYLGNYADQLIVSIFLPVEILASFSIAKKVLDIGKIFSSNIFDNLSVKLVTLKGHNSSGLNREFHKLKSLRNKICLLILFLTIPCLAFINELIVIAGLANYNGLTYLLSFAIIGCLFQLYKNLDENIVRLFLPAKTNLRYEALYSAFGIGTMFTAVLLFPGYFFLIYKPFLDIGMILILQLFLSNLRIQYA